MSTWSLQRLSRHRAAPLVVALLVTCLLAAGVATAVVRSGSDDDNTVALAPGRQQPPATSGGTTLPEASTTTEPQREPELRPEFRELQEQVAAIRGLAWKAPLRLQVVSPAELARLVREVTARDTDPVRLAAEEATLKLLDLVPDDLDYAKTLEELFGEQVVGFYDPETKEMFVRTSDDDELDALTRSVIVHEMAHALSDQHFEIGAKTDSLEQADKADELTAYITLLEGDAELTKYLWIDEHLSELEALGVILGAGADFDTSALDAAPRYLREALFFPYMQGLEFVEGRHDDGGFAAVDAAYRRPPLSTEQVLHEGAYEGQQPAAPPALPDVAGATGCAPVRSSVLGEFDMRQILEEHLTSDEAEQAATGWNGDAYTVVRCGSALAMVDRWQTDPGTDPSQLFNALREWAGGWSGTGADTAGRFSGPRGSGQVRLIPGGVELVLAEDAAAADRLIQVLG